MDYGDVAEGGMAVPRRRRTRRIIVITAVRALVIAAALAALVWLIDRYGPIDPTEPGWDAEVVNDLSTPVTVESSVEKLPIPAGGSEVFVATGPGDTELSLAITSDDAMRRCLTVRLDKHRQVTVMLSIAVPC